MSARAWAATLGSAFAMFLMSVGALGILLFGQIGGFWLVLIGWFVLRASRGSMLQELLEDRLGAIRASEAMAAECPRARPEETVEELVSGAILHRGQRHFCVEQDGELLGLVTLNQVKTVPPERRATTHVASILIPRERLQTIDGDESLWSAMQRMDDLGVNQMPVMRGGRLVGLLTREQLMSVIRNQMDLAQDAPAATSSAT